MSSSQVLSSSNKFFGSNAIIGRSLFPHVTLGSHNMPADTHKDGFNNEFTNWHCSSGAFHPLTEVNVEDFILQDDNLYVLVAKGRAIWVGTAADLIDDSTSRAQFRNSSKFATAAYEIALPTGEAAKIALIADILSGGPVSSLHAA